MKEGRKEGKIVKRRLRFVPFWFVPFLLFSSSFSLFLFFLSEIDEPHFLEAIDYELNLNYVGIKKGRFAAIDFDLGKEIRNFT